MSDFLRQALDNGLFNALLGVVGGLARIATGLAPNESLLRWLIIVITVSCPMAWIAGGYAEEQGLSEYSVDGIGFFAGFVAYNVAKTTLDLGIKDILKLLLIRGK